MNRKAIAPCMWLLGWLLSGCALSVGGDAMSACYRVNAAIEAYDARCHVTVGGSSTDCGALIVSTVDADACEAKLAAMECISKTIPLPSECHITGIEGP